MRLKTLSSLFFIGIVYKFDFMSIMQYYNER